MEKVLNYIASISTWMAKTATWLFIPLAIVIVYDVTLRYMFNMPAIWAWDLNGQFMAVIVAFGGGYTLLHKGHASIDILVSRLSPRRRALLDVIMGPFLMVGIGLLLWRISLGAWNSVMMRECYNSTWAPPIYPLKVIVAVGIGTMFLGAVADWIRNMFTVIDGKQQ